MGGTTTLLKVLANILTVKFNDWKGRKLCAARDRGSRKGDHTQNSRRETKNTLVKATFKEKRVSAVHQNQNVWISLGKLSEIETKIKKK